MKFSSLAAATAALGLMAAATTAGAAITVDYTSQDQLYDLDSGVMLRDFDATNAASTYFVGNLRGPFVSTYGVSDSAPPPYGGAGAILACCQNSTSTPYSADPTRYASVQASHTSTFGVFGGGYLTAFSFYMGSPDTYNHMVFHLLGGGQQAFDGTQIWDGDDFHGDRTKGFRVYYDLGGAKVTSITFSTESSNAFEFDSLAGSLGGVPEPATWSLMILGFGAAGAMLRRRRSAIA